jgi:nucleoside-diphosphate-sugar epimerase
MNLSCTLSGKLKNETKIEIVPVNQKFFRSSPTHLITKTKPALPARFRRPRLLVVGCGDVGERVLQALHGRLAVTVLTSSPDKLPHFRQLGARPMVGNLDQGTSLARLGPWVQNLLHLAPPPTVGRHDWRTQHLLRALRRPARSPALTPTATATPRLLRVVYGSTTGVYGHCHGEVVFEHRSTNPESARALRRVSAEGQIFAAAQSARFRASVLRIPGIYAPNREGGTPLVRLQKGLPVLHSAQDGYTNHIHADDLARACLAALWRGKPQRCYNVCDDSAMKMGDYMDAVANLYGLPLPPRVSWAEAQSLLTPMSLSFMRESRRLDNRRMKTELRFALHWPDVLQGLASQGAGKHSPLKQQGA